MLNWQQTLLEFNLGLKMDIDWLRAQKDDWSAYPGTVYAIRWIIAVHDGVYDFDRQAAFPFWDVPQRAIYYRSRQRAGETVSTAFEHPETPEGFYYTHNTTDTHIKEFPEIYQSTWEVGSTVYDTDGDVVPDRRPVFQRLPQGDVTC